MKPTTPPRSDPHADPEPAAARVHLRLLETSDVHGNLMPFDYASDKEVTRYGLARTATLIETARAEAQTCLLLDNGDFLQGTALCDSAAMSEHARPGPHPAIAVMNLLGYDAAALGNHEFNFGLDILNAALARATFPVLCANAVTRRGTKVIDDQPLVPRTAILTRTCRDTTGRPHTLNIGLIGLLPPQITTWDKFHLDGKVETRDMLETARALVPDLRARGADLVICLAHTGIGTVPARPNMENAALALAGIDGIDAILAGHSHEAFPRPGTAAARGIDHDAGTLGGVPAVMAGFRGSHLGVLDLWLSHDGTGWRVASHRAQARPVAPADAPPARAAPAILRLLTPAHATTRRMMKAPIGHSPAPIHSYLSQIQSDIAVRLVTAAKRDALAAHLAGGCFAGLPVLAASAPYKTGGRGGPGHYTDIAAGQLTLRSAADLYPFPNSLCALCLTGAQIRDWLERAASCFFQIRPHAEDQPLWNPAFPGHAFDTINGLTYEIDLTAPARYDLDGTRIANGPGRIRALRHDGTALDPEARFVMAANNYRAFGGGPYPGLPADAFALVSSEQVRDLVARFIGSGGVQVVAKEPPVWTLRPVPGAKVLFETGPGLTAYPDDMQALGLADTGRTADGFLSLRLSLSQPLANPPGTAYVTS